MLIIGYGNPGRVDDGLGPALVQRLEALKPQGATIDADYQLTVEDAAAVAEHDVVVFVDAGIKGKEPFEFCSVEREESLRFSTHSISPGGVLALAEDVFGKKPEAYVLSIRGYEFDEFAERLSERAAANLDAALGFVREFLLQRKCPVSFDCQCAGQGKAVHL